MKYNTDGSDVTEGRVDPIDVFVAKRLFQRRCLLGLSQKDLADHANVSIQQIQKYEKSINRISSGRLYRFSKLLNAPIEYFFHNVDEILEGKGKHATAFAEDQALFTHKTQDIVGEKEVIALVRFYNGVKDQNVRKKFLELIRAVSSTVGYA